MPNPPPVASGEIVATSWGNAVASRIVPVYGTPAERDAALIAPEDGQLAVVASTLEMYDHQGASWWPIVSQLGGGAGLTLHTGAGRPDEALVKLATEAPGGRSYELRRSAQYAMLELVGIQSDLTESTCFRVTDTGEVDFATRVRFGLPSGSIAPGDTMAEFITETDTGRRFRIKRGDTFGTLMIAGVQAAGTENPIMELTDDGNLRFPNVVNGTAGSGTAIGVTASGNVTKLSSSRRYKQDIAPYTPPASLGDVALSRWRYRADVDALGDDAPYRVSPIAEDVADAGLVEFVNYDAEGRPDSIDLAALALAEIGRLRTVVADLTDRLAAVEAR